jgi:hypothetical protein
MTTHITPDILASITLNSLNSNSAITAPSSTNSANWSTGYSITAGNTNPWTNAITTSGWSNGPNDLEVKGDITLRGKSLHQTLAKIEQRLAILHPNPELEASWEQLKELGNQYRELEKDLMEKQKIWSILKK